MRRREFITVLGGAAAGWPLAATAQQSAMPVIGFLHLSSPQATRQNLAAFHLGLGDAGYIEGKNVAVDYRWAQDQNDQMAPLVAELVRRQVSVIVVLESTNGALAAKAATQTIPIVFMQGADPVGIGLVDSLNNPGGNVTGIVLFLVEVAAKRLEMLRELIPAATSIAYLRNPTNPVYAETETKEMETAARALGMHLLYMNASRLNDIDTAFAILAQQSVNALLVSADGFLLTHRDYVVALAARQNVPAIYGWSTDGGLISYGTDIVATWRQAGVFTGRILKGEKPANMPVQQATKVDLIINLRTARALGLTVPPTLLRRADEVID
jgi:putative tryptophan/tyrosine transport system substrate-binding protein